MLKFTNSEIQIPEKNYYLLDYQINIQILISQRRFLFFTKKPAGKSQYRQVQILLKKLNLFLQ